MQTSVRRASLWLMSALVTLVPPTQASAQSGWQLCNEWWEHNVALIHKIDRLEALAAGDRKRQCRLARQRFELGDRAATEATCAIRADRANERDARALKTQSIRDAERARHTCGCDPYDCPSSGGCPVLKPIVRDTFNKPSNAFQCFAEEKPHAQRKR